MASAVQFSTLRDLGRKELTHFLDKYSGTKVLIWDEKLTGPMDQIARFSFLKQRRVERMFRVDQRLSAHDLEGIDNVVYVTRPDVAAMEAVANSVKGRSNSVNSPTASKFIIKENNLTQCLNIFLCSLHCSPVIVVHGFVHQKLTI